MDNFIALLVYIETVKNLLARKGVKVAKVDVTNAKQLRVDIDSQSYPRIFDMFEDNRGGFFIVEEGCCGCGRIVGDNDMTCPCEWDGDLFDEDDDDYLYDGDEETAAEIQRALGIHVLGKDRW